MGFYRVLWCFIGFYGVGWFVGWFEDGVWHFCGRFHDGFPFFVMVFLGISMVFLRGV